MPRPLLCALVTHLYLYVYVYTRGSPADYDALYDRLLTVEATMECEKLSDKAPVSIPSDFKFFFFFRGQCPVLCCDGRISSMKSLNFPRRLYSLSSFSQRIIKN